MFEISFSSLSDLEMDKVFGVLTKYGDIYLKNKCIYLFAGDIKKPVISKSMSRAVGAGNFMIKEIHPSNYSDYDGYLSDWMKSKSYNFEMSKIMAEKAEEFKRYSEAILKLKEEQAQKEKGGGDAIGETSRVEK